MLYVYNGWSKLAFINIRIFIFGEYYEIITEKLCHVFK